MKTKIDGLKAKLNQGEATFSFTKKDGTVREMTATLNPELIPGNRELKQSNEDLLRVYDLKVKGFRSVRLNSIM